MSVNGNMIKTENRVTTNGYTSSPAPNNTSSSNMGGGEHEDPFTSQTCCLVESGRQCARLAGNACYSKKIQKTVAQRKLKLHMNDNARHIYICDYHKDVIQSLRSKRKRKDSDDDDETDSEHPEVDLFQLQLNTLRRYKKHFKVHVRQGLNKAQLADSMTRHFKTLPVPDRTETVTYFIYMVKTNKSKLDRDHQSDP